jgi:glycosyltransferase involved in cell wall biosynthesis
MLTQRARTVLRERSPELQANPAPIQVIPTCVDLRKYQDADGASTRRRLGLVGKTVMVYAGSLGGWYMSEELARLFAVARTVIPGLHFLVLSQSPHELILEPLRRAGVPDDARTVVTVSPAEVPAHLASADFGVHFIRPGFSMVANSPTKFGEYLASGLPILTNRGIGDADDLIEGERTGTLVDRFDDQAFRQALEAIRALLAGGDETRRRCREVAARRLDLRTTGRESYLGLYRALAG